MNGFQRIVLLVLLAGCSKGPSPEVRADSASTARPAKDYADFRDGARYLRAGDWAHARDAFDRAQKAYPHVADWSLYYAAYAAANTGDTLGTQERIKQLDPAFVREWAWRARVTSFDKAGVPARGAAIADSAAPHLNGPVRRSEALVRSAQLHLAMHDTARALVAARIALVAGQTSPTAIAAADLVSRTATSASDLLAAAHVYLDAGSSKALPLLVRIRRLVKEPTEQRRVTYLIGQSLYTRRDYNGAVRALAPLLARGDSVGGEAMLLSARAQLRAHHGANARATAIRITRSNVRGSTKAAAHYLLADLADDANDWKTAAAHYNATIAAAPRNEYAVNSFMRLGVHALAAQDNTGALAVFKRFAIAHSGTSHAQQAFFWLGQVHARMQHTTEAREALTKARAADPYSYYGLLAGDWLKQLPSVGGAGPQTPIHVASLAQRAAARVHLLNDVGFRDAGAFELYRIMQEIGVQPGGAYALGEALVASNEAASAIRLGIQTFKKEGAWNRRLLQIVFPFPFESLIKSESKKAGVDPFLVAALIRQESTFDPAARSRVGAIGLMQMMPATAGAIARRSNDSAAELLLDPAVNVHLGVTHLRGLIDEYHGQPAYLLAAYNAGQTPVARWRKLPGGGDPLLFAERIPYAETRGYVQIVQRNAHMYRLLYGESR